MNVGEYGNVLRVNANYDMSTNIAFDIEIRQPNGVLLNVTPTLGTSLISTPLGDFQANEYVEYTFLSGDITQRGEHRVRLTYDQSATVRLKSAFSYFTVDP